MSAIRPGTASRLKTAQTQGQLGASSRLTTGLRSGTQSGGFGAASLNTMVCVEERPITQQGLGGLKNAIRGPKRQIEDKSYFLGLLRGKINEVNTEIGTITRQLMETEQENASFVQYEQMAEKLAYEIKELQGELGDYNTLVDKATLSDNITSIEMDWEEVRVANERAERNLETLFEDRQRRELVLKSSELELKQEQQMSEAVIQEMDDNERERYLKLKDLNAHLLNQLSEGQIELERLNTRKTELEEELVTSPIKQEAMHLFTQLREVESRRDQLLAEEVSKEDPQKERQRLLQQVRSDNQEIAAIDKQIHEIQEKMTNKEEELRLLEQELDESRNERSQKYRELRKREHQIDEFLKTFDSVKSLEISGISELESTIVEILETTSRYITNLNQMTSNLNMTGNLDLLSSSSATAAGTVSTTVNLLREQLDFKTNEIVKSEETVNSLAKERLRLNQDLLKVDHLEGKITQETETLRKRIAKMEEEVIIFSDLDKVREEANFKRQTVSFSQWILFSFVLNPW
uniref:Uncharacterized protein n=1 Tax=Trichobilharzia regenti TaxID=157069 RepID=A0AA85J081_TRIRE|nr:unnamed protein product [Trichobilharzia regenti]